MVESRQRVPFEKAPLDLPAQLNLLKARGMQVADDDKALHYLEHLNYYRLAAYWLPFEQDHEQHRFREGVTFDQVLNLYVFDRELRLLVMDAIERLEVSIRTRLAYVLSHRHGTHPHLNRALFRDGGIYQRCREELETEVRRSREDFIRHLKGKYAEPLPPIWAVVELMSLGQLSRWYENLKYRRDRKQIADTYCLDQGTLRSFLHHLSIVRNCCAHHARLWNRQFTFRLRLPQRPEALSESLNHEAQLENKIYNTLAMLVHMLGIISPDHHWKSRLKALMGEHDISSNAMGFPGNWEDQSFWD